MSDLIDRQAAIDALDKRFDSIPMEQTTGILLLRRDLRELPSTNTSEYPNSSDTISRQQMIGALRNYLVGKNVPCDGTLTCRLIENEVISKLPPAQPKKGRWISADAMFHGVPFYCCSECGENTRDTVMGKPRWKFCPMCGAKMEGTE